MYERIEKCEVKGKDCERISQERMMVVELEQKKGKEMENSYV